MVQNELRPTTMLDSNTKYRNSLSSWGDETQIAGNKRARHYALIPRTSYK